MCAAGHGDVVRGSAECLFPSPGVQGPQSGLGSPPHIVGGKIARRNGTANDGGRRRLSREIAHDRRARAEAVACVAKMRGCGRQVAPTTPCPWTTHQGVGGAGGGNLTAIDDHETKYCDDGSSAVWALRIVGSEMRAATVIGVAGGALEVVEEATQTSAYILGKRSGAALEPDADGLPCETLQLVGGNMVAHMTDARNRWCRDNSMMIPKAPERRKVAELSP